MAYSYTFDLPNTIVPAGTLKIQVTADLTNIADLTGTNFQFSGGSLIATGSAFLTETKTGGTITYKAAGVVGSFVITSVDSDTSITPTGVFLDTLLTEVKFFPIPTTNLLIVMDEQVEKVDVKMGLYEYDEFTLEFAEDYSWYVAGFWYNLFRLTAGSAISFFIRMGESGTDSFVIFGNVNLTSVEFNELALDEPNIANANSKIRTVKLSVTSGLDALKNVLTADAVTEILTHAVTIGGQSFVYYSDVVLVLIQLAYSQSYNTDDLQIRSNDFKYDFAGTDVPFGDLLISTLAGFSYLSDASDIHWSTLYPTAFELLSAISFSHGYIPRHYYGQNDGTYAGDASDRHKIEFLTRGQSGATLSMQGEIIDSSTTPYSPYIIESIRATSRLNEALSDFFYNTSIQPDKPQVNEKYGTPEDYLSFDTEIVHDFVIQDTSVESVQCLLFYDVGDGSTGRVDGCQFYNYQTHAWEEITPNGQDDSFSKAIARYYFYHFNGQRTYERTYSDVRSTVGGLTSQQNTRCLRRHTITDEIDSTTFYAIEIRKSYINNRATVMWFAE